MQDETYLRLAYRAAIMSNDPSTQQGAVLVSAAGEVIGVGYNRPALRSNMTAEQWLDRDYKYPRVVHAERAAIYSALRRDRGALLPRATLYAPWYACEICAELIVEFQIPRVVGHAQHPGFLDPHSKWGKAVEIGLSKLAEAQVVCDRISTPEGLGCEPIRIDYNLWTP